MFKIKPIIYVSAVIIVSVLAIAGCGGTPQPVPTQTPPTTTPTPTASATPAATLQLPDSFRYTQNLSDTEGTLLTNTVMVKQNKFRVEYSTNIAYGIGQMIIIDDGQFTWIYYPQMNQVMKFDSDPENDPTAMYTGWFVENYYGEASAEAILATMQHICDIESLCDYVEITGHETVAGQDAYKFTKHMTDGEVNVMWISHQGLLLKLVYTAGNVVNTMEFTEIDLNPSLSDSLFDIDTVAPGVPVIDLTNP
jgi:outer membrane lipoprotein-sorting protein